MKPTERIIELAKELNDLGYRQDVQQGSWVYVSIWENFMLVVQVWKNQDETNIRLTNQQVFHNDKEYIPIPSLEDGLLWLKSRVNVGQPQLTRDIAHWVCEYWNGAYCTADTPHEAVLMAMVKVLEEK